MRVAKSSGGCLENLFPASFPVGCGKPGRDDLSNSSKAKAAFAASELSRRVPKWPGAKQQSHSGKDVGKKAGGKSCFNGLIGVSLLQRALYK